MNQKVFEIEMKHYKCVINYKILKYKLIFFLKKYYTIQVFLYKIFLC